MFINLKQWGEINKKVNWLLQDERCKKVASEVFENINNINKSISIIASNIDEITAILKNIQSNWIEEYEYDVDKYKETMEWYNEDSENDVIKIKDTETWELKLYVNSKEICNELVSRRDVFKEKYVTLTTPEWGLHWVIIQLNRPDRNDNQPELLYISHPLDYINITEDMNDANYSIIDDVFVSQSKKLSFQNIKSMPELLFHEDMQSKTQVQRNYIREYLLNVQKIYPDVSIKNQKELNALLWFIAQQFWIPKKIKNLQLIVLWLLLWWQYGYFAYKNGSFFRLSTETDWRYLDYVSNWGDAFKLLMKLS